MSHQKLLQRMVGITLVALALVGCSAPAATSISSTPTATPAPPTATPTPTPIPVPIGEVEPIPEGCLYMEFFSPSDDSAYQRDQSGRIIAVITPIDRIEPLLEQWTRKEFEEAIYESSQSDKHNRHLPGVVAWEYLERYLETEDEIWTFGLLDSGFVIIRDGSVFCVVVTEHSF